VSYVSQLVLVHVVVGRDLVGRLVLYSHVKAYTQALPLD
jgi:hypothetical protein